MALPHPHPHSHHTHTREDGGDDDDDDVDFNPFSSSLSLLAPSDVPSGIHSWQWPPHEIQGSQVDEDDFVDDDEEEEDMDLDEPEDEEEEENALPSVDQARASLGDQGNQRQGSLQNDDSSEHLNTVMDREGLSARIMDHPHMQFSTSQEDSGEEEMMMSRALEGLPEWRSLSRSEWGKRSPSQQRTQAEQEVADAISKRTRAQYSLADMSLDQLETFLQESDEEDYFQNVDDEEEYRKFLAAVQEKVGTQEDDKKEKVTEESESEDEDADFEVEIEDALESDVEEGLDGAGRKKKRARRLVTREKRWKRENMRSQVLRTGLAKAPLRPILPYVGSASVVERSRFTAGRASRPWISSSKRQPSVCGFTAHQIGQLYCLMHEHVQLLLQVYSMCILEPEMQQMAVDTRRMLMELVEKREAVLSWKKSAFPDFCFRPPYTYPSVVEDEVSTSQKLSSETAQVVRNRVRASFACVISRSGPHQCGVNTESIVPLDFNSTSSGNVQPASSYQFCSPYINTNQATSPQVLPQSLPSRSCEAVDAGSASALTLQPSSGQAKLMDNALGRESALSSSSTFLESSPLKWVPATSGPVRSLMDVAPLALVREFTAVVDQIVQASRQQHFPSEILSSEHARAPLFAVQLQVNECSKLACERVKAYSPSPNLKKTMAAVLVESTKKQSIAMVPKDISAAMERFLPLFNKSLFPHRAPPASAANRLLFTDAEDELLAMGLMTYNNDWKAIQQRFLPSKSVHQIFVRQKNRSSARAPQNSIKAVRRMKLSPLTADEIACIGEALKVHQYDWTKVCHYCVPHRDPATLPRQWRVALGTQKSSMNKKAKRRVHETRRRHGFAATSQICQSVIKDYPVPYDEPGNCVDGDGEVEETQFQEGFLGNLCTPPSAVDPLRPPATPSSKPEIRLADGIRQTDSPSGCCGMPDSLSKSSRHVRSKVCTLPPTYTSRTTNEQTVKLAPGLPVLKLPPTVRVLSHSDTALVQISRIHSSSAKAAPACSINKPTGQRQ